MTELQKMGERARTAARVLATAGAAKSEALRHAADCLSRRAGEALEANAQDMEQAQAAGMRQAMLDRLKLTESRIGDMCRGIRETAAWPDPIGRVLDGSLRPNGLRMEKVCVPLGVIGIIFEARPNVTSDAAALCLQAGNAVILRGGREAFHSNCAVVRILRDALEEAGLPADAVQLVTDTTRASAQEMMGLTGYLDVLIPRGGAGLIRAVVENAKVPVIETGVGNCHMYIDESADIAMAADLAENAKTSRPSVCNAIETLLVHKNIAEKALPVIAARLAAKNVVLHADETACALVSGCIPATEADWETEYLDYNLAVRVVGSFEEAVEHIRRYSSGHSECIVTNDYRSAERFTQMVDAAAVYVNASTRFTDGGQFGLGAEIGISTQKLHARGPMGVDQLTTTKFIIRGDGQIRR